MTQGVALLPRMCPLQPPVGRSEQMDSRGLELAVGWVALQTGVSGRSDIEAPTVPEPTRLHDARAGCCVSFARDSRATRHSRQRVSAGAAVERSVRAPNVSSDVENRISHTLYTRAAPSPVGGAPTAWWRAGRVGAGVQTSAQSQTRSRHTHSDILFRCGAYAQGSCPEWQPIYGPSRPMEHSAFVENNIRSSEL